MRQISLGERATLRIREDFGYGDQGYEDAIPPNADLIFDVQLLQINDKKAPGFGQVRFLAGFRALSL